MSNERGAAVRHLLLWTVIFGLGLALTLSGTIEPAAAADADSDGLSDAMEAVFGTDPNDSDSDDDTLNDYDEIYVHGTDANLADTDGDGYDDDEDDDPLDDGDSAGGESTPSQTYADNLVHAALSGSTPFEGYRVNALSGEVSLPLVTINFGAGYVESSVLKLYYLSGITHNGRWGKNIVCNWDWWVVTQQDDDLEVYMFGQKFVINESSGTYTSPAGFPFAVTKDAQNDEYTVTAIRGGKEWIFDATDGWLTSIEDRFGNTLDITRNGSGVITTVELPEGNDLTFSTYGTGRYSGIEDWNATARSWDLTYNYFDELARFEDPTSAIWQFFYINGSTTGSLNGNLTMVKLPEEDVLFMVEYDGSDRVTEQTLPGGPATFTWTSTATTVNDPAGNQRIWHHAAGAKTPTSLVEYSNRNVRATDPATWTTTFAHNANFLLTKTVYPAGNRLDQDWDAHYCLTERRLKDSDTNTDDNGEDHYATFTYGSTYYQLEDSTDARGNTVERTLNADEQVTRVDYPDITHPTPDVSIHTTMTWNSAGQMLTYTDGEGVVTKYEYFSTGIKTGLLWKVTKDFGVSKLNLVTEYDYDNNRYRDEVEDPDGNVWTFTVDDRGSRTKITSPSPMSYEIENDYDDNGYLEEKRVENVDKTNTRVVANPWFTTTFTRDPLGMPLTITEEIDTSTTRVTSLSYDGNANRTLLTRPEGNKIQFVYDERDLLAERTRGWELLGGDDESTEKWKYDTNRNLIEHESGRGKKTIYTIDDFDRMTGETTPLGHYMSFVLDKNGNFEEIKRYSSGDILMAHCKQYYDELGRLWKSEHWLDEEAPTADRWLATEYEHDKRGLIEEVTDPEDHSTYTTYDNARRRTRWEDHLGNKIDFSYTNDYRVPTQIDEIELVPGGGTQTFVTEQVTDALHRVTERRIVDRLNAQNKRISKTKYTSLGVAVEEEDAEENKFYRTHDGLGRVIETEQEINSSEETSMTFDKNDNLTLLTDDSGNETIYRYNDRDVPYEIEYDDGEKRTFTILDDDLVGGWTDENGTVVTNTYDNDGYLTAQSINRANGVLGATSQAFAYDGMGRLTSATNNHSTVLRSWNTLSWMITENTGDNPIGQDGKPVAYEYNDDGTVSLTTFPSGFEHHQDRDAVGRQILAEDANGVDLFENTFFGPGYRSYQTTFVNGAVQTSSYNGYREPIEMSTDDDQSQMFFELGWGHNDVGVPTYVRFGHLSDTGNVFTTDKAQRLTAVEIGCVNPSAEAADGDLGDYAHGEIIAYAQDDVSNRTSVTVTPDQGSPATTYYTANSVNQYLTVGGVSQSNDDNGNLTADGTYTFSFDFMNHLVQGKFGAVTVFEAEYDALGRRIYVSLNNGAEEIYTCYDGIHGVEDYDESDDLLRTFVFDDQIDTLRLLITADAIDVDDDQNTTEVLTFTAHCDFKGSVYMLRGPDGEAAERYHYKPYGAVSFFDKDDNQVSESGLGLRNLFTGRKWDESIQKYHYRARAYDPVTGRFMQRDPLGYHDARSLYQYCGSMPTASTDPYGLEGRSYWEAVKAVNERAKADAEKTKKEIQAANDLGIAERRAAQAEIDLAGVNRDIGLIDQETYNLIVDDFTAKLARLKRERDRRIAWLIEIKARIAVLDANIALAIEMLASLPEEPGQDEGGRRYVPPGLPPCAEEHRIRVANSLADARSQVPPAWRIFFQYGGGFALGKLFGLIL